MKETSTKYLYAIAFVLGFIFLRSGFEKIEGGKFVSALGGTLTKMASNNPYPFFKSFLTSVAIPNSTIFGFLTMYGELLAGISLVLGGAFLFFNNRGNKIIHSAVLLGLITGAFLNGIFWLAAGYTSPSTDGINLVMFLVGVVLITFETSRLLNTQTK